MDFVEVVRNRRSVREYSTKSIQRAQIERLIEAAILAPSAMNQQPWAFAALLDPERIASYAQEAKGWLLANISETTFDTSARRILEDRTFVLFHGAPALSWSWPSLRSLRLLKTVVWLQKTCCWQLVMRALVAAGLVSHVRG